MSNNLPKRERVPDYHYTCRESEALLNTLAEASLEAKAALQDVLNQFFVNTATWGLDLWEQQVGIKTNSNLPVASRRSEVMKKLVANGNTTADMVRQLAETITGYEARVIVNDDYSFSLEFLGEKNSLANIDVDEIRSVVEQIKPAHLRFIIASLSWADIESVYLTWQFFDDNPTTWAEFENMFCIHAKNG